MDMRKIQAALRPASIAVVVLLTAFQAEAAVSQDANGWTVVTPSADSRVVYVSFSGGDDANDGLSPATPRKTVGAGKALLRTGFPDHLLFKRGDVWPEGLGSWRLSGRSPQEPMLVGAYGTGDRPRFDFPSGWTGLSVTGSNPETSMDNLVFMSLHLLGVGHDVTRGTPLLNGNVACVNWIRGAQDVLFEDDQFQYCQVNFNIFDGYPARRVSLRRNLFLDSFAINLTTATNVHAQCLFLAEDFAEGLVEENVMDICGWHPSVAGAEPTKFNHALYWQHFMAPDGVVRGNIIMRGASHGMQMRSSGHVEGNVLIRNAIGGFVANDHDPAASGLIDASVIGNVITESEDILPRTGHAGNELRGWGFELLNGGGGGGTWSVETRDNIITHCLGGQCMTMQANVPEANYSNNIFWNWPRGGSANFPPSPGPFQDPARTVGDYNASLGGTGTFDAFALEVRQQSKTNWRTEYTAPAIIDWFRQGFTVPGGGDTLPPARPRNLRLR